MSAANLVFRDGRILGTTSWTEGFVALKSPRKSVTEDDVLTYALWLENHGLTDDAEELLERYLVSHRASRCAT